MTKQEYAAMAVNNKRSGYNCCQAVVNAFSDKLGVDGQTLNNITSGFAVGMGGMEATCGSVVGAVSAAGIIKNGKGVPPTAREIHARFTEKSGASICKDLKGRDTGVVLCPCEDCVKNAAEALCEALGIE